MQKIPYWCKTCDGRLNSASHPSRFKMASWGMKKWRPYKKKKKTRAALHTRSLRPQSVKTPPCALSCQWQRLKSHSVSLTDSVTFQSQHRNVSSEHRLNVAARRGEQNYFLIRQFPESGAKQTYYTHDALLKKAIIYIFIGKPISSDSDIHCILDTFSDLPPLQSSQHSFHRWWCQNKLWDWTWWLR